MIRARILFAFSALLALSVALAACGGGGSDDPQTVVEEATFEGVESGDLDLAAEVQTKGAKGGDVNVNVSGPFQSEEGAELPELDVSFAVKGEVGGKKLDREGGLTLLGDEAYVAYEGTEYEVDPTTFNVVKSVLKQQEKQSGGESGSACTDALGEVELGDLAENLKDEGSADVGGTATTKVSGDLDVKGAVDVLDKMLEDPACASQLNATGALPTPAELQDNEQTIEESVKTAHVELYVGDDHIVRRLAIEATVEPPKSADASAKRVDLDLDLKLTGVNEDQSFSTPSQAKPLSALFIKLGVNPIELLGAIQNGGSAAGLGKLLEKLGPEGGGSSSNQSYYECLGKADTPVDLQNCAGLLQ